MDFQPPVNTLYGTLHNSGRLCHLIYTPLGFAPSSQIKFPTASNNLALLGINKQVPKQGYIKNKGYDTRSNDRQDQERCLAQ